MELAAPFYKNITSGVSSLGKFSDSFLFIINQYDFESTKVPGSVVSILICL